MFWILLFVFIIVPFGFGLSFARDGIMINGEHISSLEVFKGFDFSSDVFYLFGWLLSIVMLLLVVVAVLFSRAKFLKYIVLLALIPFQFICGLAYTMEGFEFRTFVVYGRQSWKVNAINVGIISVFFTSLVYLIILIVLLLLKRKLGVLSFLSSKPFIFFSLFVMYIICAIVVLNTNVLQMFNALDI